MLFVSIVYLGGLHCFVLYSAICTAQSKTAKVIADMEQEGVVQSPSGAPIAVEMSQVEDFFKSTIDSLTSKLTNKINEKLQSFKRQIVEEQSSRLDSAVKRFKKDGYFFKKEGNRQMRAGDLAWDSEDEKRLTRSDRQAERKVKAWLAKRSRQTNKRFLQVPVSRTKVQSSSPVDNSWARWTFKGSSKFGTHESFKKQHNWSLF